MSSNTLYSCAIYDSLADFRRFSELSGHKFVRISFAVSESLVEEAIKRFRRFVNRQS